MSGELPRHVVVFERDGCRWLPVSDLCSLESALRQAADANASLPVEAFACEVRAVDRDETGDAGRRAAADELIRLTGELGSYDGGDKR